MIRCLFGEFQVDKRAQFILGNTLVRFNKFQEFTSSVNVHSRREIDLISSNSSAHSANGAI